METSDSLRMKSAMVLFSLERSLGELQKQNCSGNPGLEQNGTVQQIRDRESNRGNLNTSLKDGSVVAASFLDEIVKLTIATCADSGIAEDLRGLSKILDALDVFSIRNAIAHPNRPFLESYWYRSAAIASDPVIDRLELTAVRTALQSAESGTIEPPPEEWLNHETSSIPNNLPRELEHESTGLLGRNTEAKKLEEYFRNSKFSLIAVVAPGGVGKTALILDVLRKCSVDIRSFEWCSGILFASLKLEALTPDGLKELSASENVRELREEIAENLGDLFPGIEASSFDEYCHLLSEESVLLCIDNLETLLRDNPAAFDDLYEAIPSAWTVVVTSRVSVDGAKTLPLGALKDDSAKHLTYKYLSSKGNEGLEDDRVSEICRYGKNNPLAIRLTVDRYLSGYPLASAGAEVQSQIVAFSYTNLVETLSEDAVRVLECLFARKNLRRSDLVEYLNLGEDAAAQAIADLEKTSLASRGHDADDCSLVLSPSVRDLLRDHPRDIRIREEVRQAIDKRNYEISNHQSIQRNQGQSKYYELYLEEDLPQSLSGKLTKAVRLLNKKGEAHTQVIETIRALESLEPNLRARGRTMVILGNLYRRAGDDVKAEECYQRARSECGDDPTTSVVYGDFLLFKNRYPEALKVFEELQKEGWLAPEKGDEFLSYRVSRSLFRALTELDRFEDVMELSKSFSGHSDASVNSDIAVGYALTKDAGSFHTNDQQLAIKKLLEAANRISKEPKTDQKAIKQFHRTSISYFVRECVHLMGKGLEDGELKEGMLTCLKKIEPVISLAFDTFANKKIGPNEIRSLRTFEEDGNPFHSQHWSDYCGESETVKKSLEHYSGLGFEFGSVTKVPGNSNSNVNNFVFGKTEEGTSVFIHRQRVIDLDWMAWAKIVPGSKFAYMTLEEPANEGDYPVAKDVVII